MCEVFLAFPRTHPGFTSVGHSQAGSPLSCLRIHTAIHHTRVPTSVAICVRALKNTDEPGMPHQLNLSSNEFAHPPWVAMRPANEIDHECASRLSQNILWDAFDLNQSRIMPGNRAVQRMHRFETNGPVRAP